ncbi:hypothetical protein OVA24_10010 [Luteolibacter sp. SL250]|uniref:hypothetical protein n=1 Tax=Luteolibacter sp. SL250 TaxID=2995170 RepID=UPI00226FE03E|nr:hypothetical protein [Luteolibacter sp. SL250]WAC21718.1 hypothetical protein OVA24_10010 [Luteolibacter sp. SL250]
MKSRFLLIFLALGSVAFAQLRPLEGNPGNVFLSGQEVVVKSGAADGGKWICVDYDGKQVGGGTGAEAKLGKAGVGYYEVWQLPDDGARKARTTFAVLEPLKAPVPDDTPIAIDTAAAWFYKDGAAFGFKEAASLSALAGVGWVRDRLSWPETEPEKGKLAPETKYDRSVDAFSSQGLKVLQVFHGTPKWAGADAKHFPDDYRDAYHYMKAMSARWKGKVRAWEPWNEGDTSNFGSHTGAEMMAYQKAAWHGIRAGDPDAIVGQNVFAEHRESGVIMNFIENLDATAFDTFNFHHYVRGGIPQAYATMRKASGGKPVWITESYFHFRQGVKKSDVELSDGDRKLRARFLTTNLVTGLNEGPEQFFTFVLPHYLENGILFGVLNGDNTPRADYVALAAAGRLLAGAKPLGKLDGEASAYAFDVRIDGEPKKVVAAWSGDGAALPALGAEKAYDFLGREMTVPKRVGEDPVYLVLPASAELPVKPAPKAPAAEKKDCSSLVIQTVFPPDRLRLDNSSWFLRGAETMEVPLRVYHFGKGEAAVSVTLETDAALSGTLSGNTATIGSLGRWDGTLSLKLIGAPIPARPMLVKITATAPGMDPCFSVVRINTSLGDVTPLARKEIAVAKEQGNWKPSSSKADLGFAVKEGSVEVTAKMKGGDRWVYPWLPLPAGDRPDDSWDGIAFTITAGTTPATYHAMLKEPNGATWSISLPDVPADGKPHRVVMLFDEFSWANYTPHDSSGKLDRPAIEAIAIGGNPKGDDFGYAVKGIEWVKFAK